GSSLKLIFNGVLVSSAIDTSLTTGSIGMRISQGAAVANYTADKVVIQNATLPFKDDFSKTSDGSQLSLFWSDQLGNITVVSGLATGTKDFNVSTVDGISQGDTTVQGDIALGSGQSAGLVARYGGPLYNNFYLAQLRDIGGGSFQTAIFKNVGGVFTTIAVGSTVTTGTGTMEFEVVGSSLKVIFNNTLVAFGFDTALTTGSVGMRLSQN